jgi:hypothetical protein
MHARDRIALLSAWIARDPCFCLAASRIMTTVLEPSGVLSFGWLLPDLWRLVAGYGGSTGMRSGSHVRQAVDTLKHIAGGEKEVNANDGAGLSASFRIPTALEVVHSECCAYVSDCSTVTRSAASRFLPSVSSHRNNWHASKLSLVLVSQPNESRYACLPTFQSSCSDHSFSADFPSRFVHLSSSSTLHLDKRS